jgi:hypothetical protein
VYGEDFASVPFFFFRRWTSFNRRKFWPSQRPLSIFLDPGRRRSSF